jgi:hypothetical protein
VKIFTGKRVGSVVSVLCLMWTWLDLQAAANPHPTTRWRPRVSQEAHQAQEMPRNTLHARAGQLVQGQLEDAPRKRRHLKRSFMFVWNFFTGKWSVNIYSFYRYQSMTLFIFKGTVAPYLIGLKVIWLDRPC